MRASQEILLVDDDPAVRAVFARALELAGYIVTPCADGVSALEQWRARAPALIILDVEMPRSNGWQTLAELRRQGCAQPVLMVTHDDAVSSRIQGLEAGADDYVGKPCDAGELIARVRALLRRSGPATAAPRDLVLRFGDIEVDLRAKASRQGEASIRLTPTDYRLLGLLQQHLGAPVSTALIVEKVWGSKGDASHAVETHVWRLRKKLNDSGSTPRWIRFVPGAGYVLDPIVVRAMRG